jgi:hypothetical protein
VVAGFELICSAIFVAVKKIVIFRKTKLTLMSHKQRIMQIMFHAPSDPLETTQILSEAFPDAMDKTGVTLGNHVKWFYLYDI